MARPPKPPNPPGRGGPLRRRILVAQGRPEVQTALALLDRGDLREAARVLETSGVHAAAAVIRLEHATGANTNLRDRIAMLREGCARNPGDTEEGQALHRALAEALLRQAETMADGAPRRALLIEAARALEDADRGEDAGMIYERLGFWQRAAQAYERAGAISNLEYALEIIGKQEAAQAAIDAAAIAVDDALRIGHRRLAHTLLGEHTSERFLPTQHRSRLPRLGLVRRLAALEQALPHRDRIHLAWSSPQGERITVLHTASPLRIGRSPDADLPIAAPTLSREHVHLQLSPGLPPAPPGVALTATDQGSRVGTFWDGEALLAGEPEPLTYGAELGLGFASMIEVWPLTDEGAAPRQDPRGALLRIAGEPVWHLFLPEGGPLVLSPEHRPPATVAWSPPFLEVAAGPTCRVRLNSTLLEHGARIEALLGDRLEFLPDGGPSTTITLLR